MTKEILKTLVLGDEEIYSKVCTVLSVDGLTCRVAPVDGDAEIEDVRLTANPTSSKFFAAIPKVGSVVVVTWLTAAVAFVSLVDEVESVVAKIDTVEFEATGDKVSIKKGTDSLSQVLSDMIAEVNKIVVMIGTSPNVAALEAIDERQKQFLG